MLLRISQFKGMAPSIAADQLSDHMAQLAVNCRLDMGSVRPISNVSDDGVEPSKSGIILSLYEYDSKWFNWISDVNIVSSPLAEDAFGRRYWTGDGTPKMTARGIATSTNDYPSVSYELGIPSPVSQPQLQTSGVATDEDPTLAESRAYVYTYVSVYGEEGPPSPPSDVVTIQPGQSVDVMGMAGAPVGAYNIVYKRIYRTNTGSGTTEYQYVGSIEVSVAAYSDVVSSDELGVVLPSVTWDAPPQDLKGLISLPNGCLAGFSGNLICFSEPYLPHAWPVSYRIPLDTDVVAIGSYGNNILVATEGAPYLIQATTPGGMAAEKLEMGYACMAKRGFVDIGYACVYPAINGLMLAGMGNIQLATAGILTQKEWQTLNPSSIHAYLHDSKYIGFWDNDLSEGFVFDPQTGDLTLHDVPATAGFHNPSSGTLHVVTNGVIRQWEGGNAKTATWKSKKFIMPYPHNLACANVVASAYPVTFKLYADGVLRQTKIVTTPEPFRLASGFKPNSYEVEVSGAKVITAINIASSMQELSQV